MSINSSLAVQQAIYNRLSADTTLSGLITGVFDSVPQGTLYPYIAIDEELIKNWSTSTTDGAEIRLVIHVFSRESGRKQLLGIFERVYFLLHEASLSVSGHSFTHIRFLEQEVELESDAITFHGMQKYRITTHL